eukprot:COSAG01_NODE_15657_length_1314_cov_1.520165_1_plen_284_part_00
MAGLPIAAGRGGGSAASTPPAEREHPAAQRPRSAAIASTCHRMASEAPDEGEQRLERQIQQVLGALNRHAFFNVCVVCTTIQAEIQLVKGLFGGDAAATAVFLSTTSSCVRTYCRPSSYSTRAVRVPTTSDPGVVASCVLQAGLTEFILNPTIGRLSDTFGRRRFLLLGCSYAVVGNTLVGLFPTSRFLVGANRFLNWSLLTVSGSVTGSAAISDISPPGPALAMNLGSFFSSFGLGVIVGPMIGGFVLARTGRPNTVYFARAAIAGVELVSVSASTCQPRDL